MGVLHNSWELFWHVSWQDIESWISWSEKSVKVQCLKEWKASSSWGFTHALTNDCHKSTNPGLGKCCAVNIDRNIMVWSLSLRICHQGQGLVNDNLCFVNKALLEHSHIYSFAFCLWPQSWVALAGITRAVRSKILTYGPLRRKFVDN